MTLAQGSRLGSYEVLSPLGAGGMGEVYRARDSRLGRDVAIKVLPAAVASDPDRLRRFEREARSASALNHPAIVTIYEIGQSDDVAYMAMELVDGVTLRQLLADGPFPVRRLISISAQMAEGLAKAHAAGIVHRDLKPENVMVTKDGFVKILDFGLAKLTAAESEAGQETAAATVSAATEPGVVMGTVGYMSPEQARGGPLDFRSDQFALGSVLYEMATGRRAFAGETRPEVMAAIIREEPEPIADRESEDPGADSLDHRTVSREEPGRALRLDGGSGSRPALHGGAPVGALERFRRRFALRRRAEASGPAVGRASSRRVHHRRRWARGSRGDARPPPRRSPRSGA